jgi:HK97 family phage prohead protease
MTTKSDTPALEVRSQQVRLERKQVNSEGEFEGYGSVFGVEDSYGDVVAQGAFAESLKEHASAGTMPALLWQHNTSEPIGVYLEMREDERGLYVKGQLERETQRGKEAHALLKSGALNGLSIGYMPRKWEFDEETNIMTLQEVDLWECSLVTFPANSSARVSGFKAKQKIDSLADWKSFEKTLRDAGFSNDAAAGMAASARRIRDSERDARAAMTEIHAGHERLLNLMTSGE